MRIPHGHRATSDGSHRAADDGTFSVIPDRLTNTGSDRRTEITEAAAALVLSANLVAALPEHAANPTISNTRRVDCHIETPFRTRDERTPDPTGSCEPCTCDSR